MVDSAVVSEPELSKFYYIKKVTDFPFWGSENHNSWKNCSPPKYIPFASKYIRFTPKYIRFAPKYICFATKYIRFTPK